MKDSTKRTLRTVLQLVVGLAAALPLIVGASGLPETMPGLGVALGVAAGVTRVLALPAVNDLLPSWLRVDLPDA
jgi:hypothetical protein